MHSADVITTASAWSSAAENEGPLTGSPASSRQHREAAGPACRGGFTLTPDLEADYCGGQRGTRATRGVPFFAPTTQGSGMMIGNTPTLGMDPGRTKVLMPLVDKRGIPERRLPVGTARHRNGGYLAAAGVGLVNAFNPEALVLGGGVIEALPELVYRRRGGQVGPACYPRRSDGAEGGPRRRRRSRWSCRLGSSSLRKRLVIDVTRTRSFQVVDRTANLTAQSPTGSNHEDSL